MLHNIKKYEYIDALRGLAVLMVLFIHTGMICNFAGMGYFKTFINNGKYGVQLFYMLSAFTLCLSFNKRITTEKLPIMNFFIRRFFRIAPLYYSILIICMMCNLHSVYWLGNDLNNLNIKNTAMHFIFINGFFPFYINSILGGEWSIAIEMQFYIIFPVLFHFFNKINIKVTIVCMILWSILIYLTNNYLTHHTNPINNIEIWTAYLYLYLPSQLIFFIYGILLYKIKQLSNITINSIFQYPVIIIIITGLFLFNSVHKISFILFILIFILSLFNTKCIVNKIFIQIGKLSYSVYLIHLLLINFLLNSSIPQKLSISSTNSIPQYLIIFILLLVISSFISFITYKFIEVPFQKLGNKIIAIYDKRS